MLTHTPARTHAHTNSTVYAAGLAFRSELSKWTLIRSTKLQDLVCNYVLFVPLLSVRNALIRGLLKGHFNPLSFCFGSGD